MIVSLNCDVFQFDCDDATLAFSVASGTIGFVSDVEVSLISSDAFTSPEVIFLKLFLNSLKDIDPELNQGVAGTLSTLKVQVNQHSKENYQSL